MIDTTHIDRQYQRLLLEITNVGVTKQDRTGTGTKSIFGYQLRHKMSDGFPLLTTKKMAWKQIVTELLWFLRGDTNIKYLLENDCNIWVGDAYKNYTKHTSANSSEYDKWMRDNGNGTLSMYTETEFIEKIKTDNDFAKKWGDLGPIYGKQWRSWDDKIVEWNEGSEGGFTVHQRYIDQIANLINDLKNNPDSRRMMVNAWNVADIDKAVLPPCHYGFQCWTRELTLTERQHLWLKTKDQEYIDMFENDNEEYNKNTITHEYLTSYNIPTRAISLMWNQRSVDTFLGLPFNIASYALLLEILANEVKMVPDELIANLGDTHLYLNHLNVAVEQMIRDPFELPKLEINSFRSDTNTIIGDITKWSPKDFQIIGYKSHPAIKAPLSN